jgi:hypothetical protein
MAETRQQELKLRTVAADGEARPAERLVWTAPTIEYLALRDALTTTPNVLKNDGSTQYT